MKARELKELYEILFNHIKDKNYIHALCDEIYDLKSNSIINPFDYYILKAHFKSQKNIHREFMTSERNWIGGQYWWSAAEDYNPINRKAFIQKIISTL